MNTPGATLSNATRTSHHLSVLLCSTLPDIITEASVEAFCGGVDGVVSHEAGLVFTTFTGVLWKQPSTHFLKLFTGESSTFDSPVVTHWTARSAWNRITGFVVLFCKFSPVELGTVLSCSELSAAFNWVISFLSSLSLVSVKQIKFRRSFSGPFEHWNHSIRTHTSSHWAAYFQSANHFSNVEIILNCFRCFGTISNAKVYKITPKRNNSFDTNTKPQHDCIPEYLKCLIHFRFDPFLNV